MKQSLERRRYNKTVVVLPHCPSSPLFVRTCRLHRTQPSSSLSTGGGGHQVLGSVLFISTVTSLGQTFIRVLQYRWYRVWRYKIVTQIAQPSKTFTTEILGTVQPSSLTIIYSPHSKPEWGHKLMIGKPWLATGVLICSTLYSMFRYLCLLTVVVLVATLHPTASRQKMWARSALPQQRQTTNSYCQSLQQCFPDFIPSQPAESRDLSCWLCLCRAMAISHVSL